MGGGFGYFTLWNSLSNVNHVNHVNRSATSRGLELPRQGGMNGGANEALSIDFTKVRRDT